MYNTIIYIAQSILPSSSANSIQVVNMCVALSKHVETVKLFFATGSYSSVGGKENLFYKTKRDYNIPNGIDLIPTRRFKVKAGSIFYAISAFIRSLQHKRESNLLIYTRCIYSAFLHCLFCKSPLVYEKHAPGRTNIHRRLEKYVLCSKRCIAVVFITNALKKHYSVTFKKPSIHSKFIVLPDGAHLPCANNVEYNKEVFDKKRKNVVYTGSLLPGKGADLVVELASYMPDMNFIIVGGSKEQLKPISQLGLKNLKITGQVSHSEVYAYQKAADILLLPNKEVVLTDGGRVDIGRWTSPLKLFEYMTTGNPVIASDIDVLKEVLVNRQNCLLANPNDLNDWQRCITSLSTDRNLAKRISSNALYDVKTKYSWENRAQHLLSFLNHNDLRE